MAAPVNVALHMDKYGERKLKFRLIKISFYLNSNCLFFPLKNQVLECALNHVGVTSRERLDQGHLHPKLEVLRQTCPGWESDPGLRGGGEHSRK
jgi:hypothetical protein